MVIQLSSESGGTVEMAVTGESEPRAGYYVSTQDRPAFVSELSSEDFDDVFGLMRKNHDRRANSARGSKAHRNSSKPPGG